MNWAPRLGATYQWDEKTVIRAGFGRSYDIGVFGSLFGHSVTQNLPVLAGQSLNGPESFDAAFNLDQGPAGAHVPRRSVPTGGSCCRTASARTPTRARSGRQRSNAFNVTVQRQLTDTTSVEVGYVGNRGHNVFAGDGPEFNVNQPTIVGFAQGVPQNERRPFYSGIKTTYLGLGGPFGLSQGINYFCDCATNSYDALQAKFTKRFSERLPDVGQLHAAEGPGPQRRLLPVGPEPELRRAGLGPDEHCSTSTLVWEIPFGKDKRWGSNVSPAADAFLGGWQFNATHTMQSGVPFNVGYNDSGADRDTGPGRPNLTGNP